jgi:hypothetical protein
MLDSCPLTLRNACNSKAYTFRRETRVSEARRWRTVVQDAGNGSGDGIVGAPTELMVEVRQIEDELGIEIKHGTIIQTPVTRPPTP